MLFEDQRYKTDKYPIKYINKFVIVSQRKKRRREKRQIHVKKFKVKLSDSANPSKIKLIFVVLQH